MLTWTEAAETVENTAPIQNIQSEPGTAPPFFALLDKQTALREPSFVQIRTAFIH